MRNSKQCTFAPVALFAFLVTSGTDACATETDSTGTGGVKQANAKVDSHQSIAASVPRGHRAVSSDSQSDCAMEARSVGKGTRRLTGQVSVSENGTPVTQRIDELLDAALDKDPRTKELDKAVKHYRSMPARIIASSKDAMNFVVPYRGFAQSSEAGDIITGEKLSLKSRSSVEYARQQRIDDLHVRVVSSVMQMAMGLGMNDQIRGQQIVAREVTTLSDLAGQEEADKTVKTLSALGKQISVPESVYKQNVWDVDQQKEKYSKITSTALNSDPVVLQIKDHLHKYNHRSKGAMAAGRIFYTVFGITALGPDLIGAAGEAALVSFAMATGGPEQAKIMKELYLDRRFESRCKVVSEETHLALQNYQLGVLTQNPLLVACSESIINQMAGSETVSQICDNNLLSTKLEPTTESALTGLAAGPAQVLK